MSKNYIIFIFSILFLVSCRSKDNPIQNSSEKKTSLNTKNIKDINWPSKPVEVIVHARAGGDTDFNARTLAKYFKKITGQPMIVKNMEGGGGSLATSYVKNAKPNGYTLLCTHTGPMLVNEISGLVDYNFNDFEVSNLFAVDKSLVLVANKKSNITSIEDLLKKSKQKEFIYGSELGSSTHLQGLMLEEATGIKLKIVDTGSVPDKVESLLDGYTELSIVSYGSIVEYEKTGELVILAQFNKERNEYLPHIPTLIEKNINLFIEKPYVAAFPLGTNSAIVDKLDSIVSKIVKDKGYIGELKKFKQSVTYYPKDEAKLYLKNMRDKFLKYRNLLKK